MGLAILIVLIIGALILIYGFGIGKDAITDIQASIREAQEKQKDQTDPSLQTTGNFAKDIGGRVCDLRIEFVGLMNDINPFFGDPLNIADDRFLVLGTHSQFTFYDFDKRIIVYQWFCPDQAVPFSLAGWELGKMSLLSFGLDKSDGEVVRFKFQGISKQNGKLLFDSTGKGTATNPFQASSRVPFGVDFPVEFKVPIYLEDVTEDNYIIEWWSEDYSVNGKDESHHFNYNLCKSGLSSC